MRSVEAWRTNSALALPEIGHSKMCEDWLVGLPNTSHNRTVERTVELTNYRVTAGLGLRIVVPMLGPVPIALDFGVPIVKGPDDRKQLFSFWLGFFN